MFTSITRTPTSVMRPLKQRHIVELTHHCVYSSYFLMVSLEAHGHYKYAAAALLFFTTGEIVKLLTGQRNDEH